MHVPSANESIHHFAIAEEQTAALARRRLACVRDDLVPQPAWEDDARALDQRPPAIAGMTMTSLPSGTTAPLPPRVRASSSPMYTLTYERSAPPSSSTREANPGGRRSISGITSRSVPPDPVSLVLPPA